MDPVDELIEGQTNERLKTRADVDRFDARFEGEVAASADASSDEESLPADTTQDLDTNKVCCLCMLSVMLMSFFAMQLLFVLLALLA